MALLEVNHLTKSYGEESIVTNVLHGVTFSIAAGEFVAIMGPSGSGKSTLLHILGLLDRPTTGSYVLDGRDSAALNDDERAALRNSDIGFIFQAFHLLARTSVLENVMLPLAYSRVPRSRHTARAKEVLSHVGMSHRLSHVPSQLSGGERQRVAIARALVGNPKLILADEPTGNLDTKTGAEVMKTIDELHSEGRTVIVVTHEQGAAAYAGRVITFKDGRVSADVAQERHGHYQK